MKKYMTWREIHPELLRGMTPNKTYSRAELKDMTEKTPGYDHGVGHYENNSMTGYRTGWCLTLMKNAGLLENVGTGLWKLSDKATSMKLNDITALLQETSQNMTNSAAQKSKKAAKAKKEESTMTQTSNADTNPAANVLEKIKSLLSLSKEGLITQEVALLGIEKATFSK